jgi:hypothetical protein
LRAGTPHRLPGIMADRRIHWKVSSPGGTETILAIASRVALTDLERDLATFPHASYGTPVDLGQLSAGASRSLRAIGGLEQSPASAELRTKLHLADALKTLPEDAPQRQSAWFWQTQLQNPVP